MKPIYYSFIVPVFNRPEEIEKLLQSISHLSFDRKFEVVIIEDGSDISCEEVCSRFRESVNITYLFKPNSGPGDSRNYGMKKATGDYFIILDSDCILPPEYLNEVDNYLSDDYVECYGGPDAAHESFSDLQKAINYSMTSFFTTGGIRGGNENLGRFQPRSFNMGLSRKAFEQTGGFRKIHPGEDPDLTLRLWQLNLSTALITKAHVYHERRISWALFYKQVNKFGKVRVILNKWHPDSTKLTYWFPAVFIFSLLASLIFLLIGIFWPVLFFAVYFLIIIIDSTIKNGIKIGFKSIFATLIQFYGYGIGFLKAWIKIVILKTPERKAFPKLFFK
ncbi:cellulose synthase/poly-beta-1,6-N-acetylglucosamine synthase-like glycosyltransferase [Nonlabens dokdonensis]|uniref:Cellulose synthase/poly-beta-1,6-N-acetylglucosamine synthase-like glycosyltransferase n=1 Tax=Nonlabens dokdonensis TaxID=328515 RepID=A0ABX5PW87_9FLAO|nr:glycosyltransferase [Nonlabens dokdonensis]PZX39156.1 cellulose synthase/poly-beta-1,6-N-acetylglucosamine synthase-like glycosyltransferase [Nonlabens dokdonensis]